MKFDKKQQKALVETFYKGKRERDVLLEVLEGDVRGIANSICFLSRVKIGAREKKSEIVFALLGTMEDLSKDENLDMYEQFRTRFRRQLRERDTKKSHVDIADVVIVDEAPDPLKQVLQKEQVWLAKRYLTTIATPVEVHQFLRHFMDGVTFRQIAKEDGESENYLSKKMNKMFEQLKAHMKRLNNEA